MVFWIVCIFLGWWRSVILTPTVIGEQNELKVGGQGSGEKRGEDFYSSPSGKNSKTFFGCPVSIVEEGLLPSLRNAT